ncbi:hypothetical protein RclHR1_06830002 [Rhizophagus clarus]|uniref:Jacalin-type lectin domain-containing protein n=1 Tax=Rhizophagus clarus TaxID=94130 RepID=A0A2Z6RUN4_9GLOM|nr:hypothetical protein RclHR1_06830002 [Rhizophagus clarus]GES76116.1 hypothetical protein GLOIN_2v1824133 [Rhizophagus clarus]
MISRKLSLLAIVTLFCMIFIEITQSVPYSGSVAYCDFPDPPEDVPVGRITFANFGSTRDYGTRVYGQFNQGFKKDANINNYEFVAETREGKINYTKEFRKSIKISSVGGTAPFQIDYKGDFTIVNKIVGGKFNIIHKGVKVVSGEIKHV